MSLVEKSCIVVVGAGCTGDEGWLTGALRANGTLTESKVVMSATLSTLVVLTPAILLIIIFL